MSDMSVYEICNFIKAELRCIGDSFVSIGYYLKQVRDRKLYTETGHKDIWEFAQVQFGISKSSASRFMSINDKFSLNGNSPELLEEYKGFSSSKLSEMLTLPEEQLKEIKPDMTREQIREMKPKKDKEESIDWIEKYCQMQLTVEAQELLLSDENLFSKYFMNNHICKSFTSDHYYGTGLKGYSDKNQYVFTKNNTPDKKYTWEELLDHIITRVKDGSIRQQNLHSNKDDLNFIKQLKSGEEQIPGQANIEDYPEELPSVAPAQQENKKMCFFNSDSECTIKGCSEVANNTMDIECDGICCNGCDMNMDCGARCNNVQLKVISEEPANEIDNNSKEIHNDVQEKDPEYFNLSDIKWLLKDKISNLKQMRDLQMVNRARIHMAMDVAAYSKLVDDYQDSQEEAVKRDINHALNFYNLQDYDNADFYLFQARKSIYDTCGYDRKQTFKPELYEFKPKRPELPLLKNNDQRKEWIEAYQTWPVWIYLELTGEKYYRYDFDNGESFVVKVSTCHKWIGTKGYRNEVEYGKEVYYILGHECKEAYRPKNPTFSESESNKSAMVEYLKEYQKK